MFRCPLRLFPAAGCLGGLRLTHPLLAPTQHAGAGQRVSAEASVMLPAGKVGRAAAEALRFTSPHPSRVPVARQGLAEHPAESPTQGRTRGARLVVPPVAAHGRREGGPRSMPAAEHMDVEGELSGAARDEAEDGVEDVELAALVAAHKARHGGLESATDRVVGSSRRVRAAAVGLVGTAEANNAEVEVEEEAGARAARLTGIRRSRAAAITAEEAEPHEAAPASSASTARRRRQAAPVLAEDVGGEAMEEAAAAVSSQLTNPFRGLHGCLTRSYRLDQLLSTATHGDAIFARQEKKSTAFSFLQFKGGKDLYTGHWGSLEDLRSAHQRQVFPGGFKDGTVSEMFARLRQGGTPVPGFSLFNNNLGLYDPRVMSSFPLVLAQRLLLFPDGMRHFHTLCGRENVPCDFFADVDLPDVSPAEAERVLLEILNYLEVRLPGVGFTDPFFLVLTNAEPSADKASFHIHARSMTYRQEEAALNLNRASTDAASKTSRKKGKAGSSPADEEADDELDAEYDDLSDLVNVVESEIGAKKKKPQVITTPRVIAFHDFRTVKLLADEVNQTLGKTVIDDGCYRTNSLLRCAFSAKLASAQNHSAPNGTSGTRKQLVPLLKAKDPALRAKLQSMEEVLRTMTDPEILELSFCNRYLDDAELSKFVRHHLKDTLPERPRGAEEKAAKEAALRAAHRHRFKLLRPRHIIGPAGAQSQEYDAYGNLVSPFLTEGAKWRRYNAVVRKLRTLPVRAADSFDVWVRVGLALHNFSNEDHVFEEWVRFSLKCPQKYSREACRKKWVQFERNPDALNWRRGYNYLNSTVWRQV